MYNYINFYLKIVRICKSWYAMGDR